MNKEQKISNLERLYSYLVRIRQLERASHVRREISYLTKSK